MLSDVITAALIGVGGAVIVAVCSVVTQVFITKAVIDAERQKMVRHLHGEDILRRKGRRQEQILDTMSELLVVSDPETLGGVDCGRAGNLISRLQLLLDLGIPAEKKLNGAINRLGHALRETSIAGTIESEKANILLLHSHALDLAGIVIRELPDSIE